MNMFFEKFTKKGHVILTVVPYITYLNNGTFKTTYTHSKNCQILYRIHIKNI